MKDKTKGVQQVIQSIYDADGEVKASRLVDAARLKTSPAHAAFEWNDKVAGEEYRLIQARHYIKRVTIIRDDKPEVLHHVPIKRGADEKEGSYKPATVIVESVDEFDRALTEALSKLHAARRAVDALQAAAEKREGDDRVAMVAQIAKGLGLLEEALKTAH